MKFLLADSQRIVCEGLHALIEKRPGWKVVGDVSDGRMVVQSAKELQPDIVIMDVTMPSLSGIEATRQITEQNTRIKIIALSLRSERHFIADMFKAGASGYVLKTCFFDDLVYAIQTVSTGEIYLSPRISSIVIDDYVNDGSALKPSIESILTCKEREVIQLLTEGKSCKEIAAQWQVSDKTIHAHRRQIMNKLNIHDTAKLTKYAIREGLTSLEF